METILETIAEAHAALMVAGEAAFEAADMISDHNADSWAEAGLSGIPRTPTTAQRLYQVSRQIEALMVALDDIREDLEQ